MTTNPLIPDLKERLKAMISESTKLFEQFLLQKVQQVSVPLQRVSQFVGN